MPAGATLLCLRQLISKIPADSYATPFIYWQGVTVSPYIRCSIITIAQLLFSSERLRSFDTSQRVPRNNKCRG